MNGNKLKVWFMNEGRIFYVFYILYLEKMGRIIVFNYSHETLLVGCLQESYSKSP